MLSKAIHRSPLGLLGASAFLAALGFSCSQGDDQGSSITPSGVGGSGGAHVGPGGSGQGGSSGVAVGGFGGQGAEGPINPCRSECGSEELCDGLHLGLDDNCDGTVDEGCSCTPGQAASCFMGDPSYIDAPGCAPGTMRCGESGFWGPCLGGAHATGPEPCFEGSTASCADITAAPFETVDLRSELGTFTQGAASLTFEVECPSGVTVCPAVQNDYELQPLQSGEYTVHATKTLAAGGEETCTFALRVGAPGLRVELSWNFELGVDLDLHLLRPGSTAGFSVAASGAAHDCGYGNCRFSRIVQGGGTVPDWFPVSAPEGAPVRWYLDPVVERNTCYFAPRGLGASWQSYGQGCHNPRLDLDNLACNTSISDPNHAEFCAPENINIDFPPLGNWMRIGVHHFAGAVDGILPVVKVFCDGSLAAELGPNGYYDPERAVGFNAGTAGRLWAVADVGFVEDEDEESGCIQRRCVVQPVYADAETRTPAILQSSGTNAYPIGPSYPSGPPE